MESVPLGGWLSQWDRVATNSTNAVDLIPKQANGGLVPVFNKN